MRLSLLLVLVPFTLFSMDTPENHVEKAKKELVDVYTELYNNVSLDRCLENNCQATFSSLINKLDTVVDSTGEYCDENFYKDIYRNHVLLCLTHAEARATMINSIGKEHTLRRAERIVGLNCITHQEMKTLTHPLSNTLYMMAESQRAVMILKLHEKKMRKKAGL